MVLPGVRRKCSSGRLQTEVSEPDLRKLLRRYVSPTHRPSLASWDGYPWEAMRIMEQRDCGLRGGLAPTSPLNIGWTGIEGQDRPEKIEARNGVGASHGGAGTFVQIWSKGGGAPATSPAASPAASPVAATEDAPGVDIEAAVEKARSAYYTMLHGLLKKQGDKVEPLKQFVAKSLQ